MSAATPIPPRASIRDLLGDLLGHAIVVGESDLQRLAPERTAYASVYRRDDGTVAASLVCDLDLAASCGAAIGMMGPEAAVAATDGGQLDEDTLEFFQEVSNVFAKLLNAANAPHVVVRETVPLPGEVPREVAEVLLEPGERVDLRVEVDGYGPGTMTLLIA